jgi:hypothetical protein
MGAPSREATYQDVIDAPENDAIEIDLARLWWGMPIRASEPYGFGELEY